MDQLKGFEIDEARTRLIVKAEMVAYRSARANRDSIAAWRALERAHIVSQPFLWLHLSNHWAMLGFAFTERDPKEIFGQLVRLALASLGALTGRVPVGNTGRSNVSAFQPMPIPDDLRHAIKPKKP
jgi:Protein of unknown function (DUF3703)